MASLKDRWAQALAEAEAKAAGMSEDDINANLGPATRRAFDAAEKMEGAFQRLFAGMAAPIGWIFGIGLMGWAMGTFVHRHIGPLWLVLALAAAAFLFVFLSTARARKRGQDVPYFAGMTGFLACSAAGEGTEDAAVMGMVLFAAVGLAHLFVRRGAPPDLGQAATPERPQDGGTKAEETA